MAKNKKVENELGEKELKTVGHQVQKLAMKIGGVLLMVLGLCVIAITLVIQYAIKDLYQIGGIVFEDLKWTPSGTYGFMNTVVSQGITVSYVFIAAGILIIIGGIVAIVYSKKV